jgi:hypothetical protein
MTLIFEPERVIYDATERVIRIFAIDGPNPISCAVLKAALIALEDDALAGPHAMTITYRRHRSLIREIAERANIRQVNSNPAAASSFAAWTLPTASKAQHHRPPIWVIRRASGADR